MKKRTRPLAWWLMMGGVALQGAFLLGPRPLAAQDALAPEVAAKRIRQAIEGIAWRPDLATALAEAHAQQRLVLHMQLVGELTGGL